MYVCMEITSVFTIMLCYLTVPLTNNIYILQVVDMPIDHPSCSKQHAALQYRLVQVENEEGKNIKVVK